MTRLLLGQLGANGDCLYATILARQIRHDYPDAHITWAISSQCSDILRNNPYIDDIWVIPVPRWDDHAPMWRVFEREATRRLLRHEYDHAFLSQIWPNNFQNYDGTVRPSILRSYGRPITVPIENIIQLTDEEKEKTAQYVRDGNIAAFDHRIMFECSARSGQSFVTPDVAQEVAEHVYAKLPNTTVMFCTNVPMELKHPNSRHAGTVSLRECAELTRSCTLFVGCGSGVTVAATSTAAARLPMIQLLFNHTSVYASFVHDFEHFGLPHEHILEMTDERPEYIAECIVTACTAGMETAKQRFDVRIPVRFDHYSQLITWNLLDVRRYLDAARSLTATAARYGWRGELVAFAQEKVVPQLPLDVGWVFPERRREAEKFMDDLAVAAKSSA